MVQVPSSNARQGSQCRPVGLCRHVGPSAIPRKFPAIILGTESHGGNSKEHNYPHPQDYSILWDSLKDFTAPTGNQLASGTTQQQTSHMSSAATHSRHAPKPNGANESHRRVSKPDRKYTLCPKKHARHF